MEEVTWTPLHVLSVAAYKVRRHGWTSDDDARKRGTIGTAGKVVRALIGEDPLPELEQRDVDKACEALSFARNVRENEALSGTLIDSDKVLLDALERWDREGIRQDELAYASVLMVFYVNGPGKYERKQQWASLKDRPFFPAQAETRVIINTEVRVINKITKVLVAGECTCETPHGWKSKQEGKCPTAKGRSEVYTYQLLGEDGYAYKVLGTKHNLVEGSTVFLESARLDRFEAFQDVNWNVLKRPTFKEVE